MKKTFLYRLLIFIALAIPILIGAYHVCGTDAFTYMRNYLTVRRIPKEELFEGLTIFSELGHRTFTKFCGYFKSVRFYFGAYSAATIFFMYKANQKIKPESVAMVSFIFYILFFLSSFNAMRQTLAIVIVAFAFRYIFEKKFIKYIFFILLAASFHLSALIVLPAYFLWTKDEKLLPWPILAVIMLVAAVVSINLSDFLALFADAEFETERLQGYIGYGEYKGDSVFKNYTFYLDLLVGIIFAIHHKRLVMLDKKNGLFAFMWYLNVVFGFSGFISPFAKRIGWYFQISSVWLLADLPNCYTDHHSKWSARLLVILYAVLRFTISAYILGQSDIIPYVWVLPYWARF